MKKVKFTLGLTLMSIILLLMGCNNSSKLAGNWMIEEGRVYFQIIKFKDDPSKSIDGIKITEDGKAQLLLNIQGMVMEVKTIFDVEYRKNRFYLMYEGDEVFSADYSLNGDRLQFDLSGEDTGERIVLKKL